MSIQSEINRISQNVSDSLDAVEAKGVTIPTGSTSDDLPQLISSIDTGSSVVVTPTLLSGTDIASITVDGSSTTLYAPTPPSPSDATPQALGTASAGSSSDYSRADHVHQKEKGSRTWYGTCGTAAATAAKVVTTTTGDFALETGATVKIKFTYNNTATNVTLSIDGSDAKYVKLTPTEYLYAYYWHPGEVVEVVYAGGDFLVVDGEYATTTYYGVTKLSDSTTSTSSYTAATSKAVKTVKDAIPVAATATPQNLGTAAVGTSKKWAKEDHVHALPTYTKSDVGLGNVDNVQQYSASNPPPYPVTSVNGSTGAVTVSVPSAATATPSDLGTAAVGTSTKWAKEDHVHKMPSASDVGALPSSTVIPSKVSDLNNDSGFVNASGAAAAAPVQSVNGQTGAVTVVEDDQTWNGVSLVKQNATNTGDSTYVPLATSLTPVNMSFTPVKKTPTANAIAKYDNSSYLYSTTPSDNDNSTKVATTAYVDSAIDDLPEPMVFKGSLGTGGTITTLPAASSSNTGFTYKVITAGTYASQAAKVGDTFISDGTAWVLIPSGDEPSGTVTSVGVSNATNGGLSVSGSPVTSSGTITIGHSNVLTNAQTTQAVYPIKIDKNGHISAYGSAVSVPTKTSDLTNDSGFITSSSVPAAATVAPVMDGTAAVGTSSKYAKEDHRHPSDTAKIDRDAELLTTNTFAPNSMRGPYISKIDNAFYAADKRWSVTATNVASGSVSNLFNGNYENSIFIENGNTSVITIDFSSEPTGYFPGYPYGYIILSFYYVAGPASVSGRVYCNYSTQGVGWHNITFTPLADNTVNNIIYKSGHQSYYNISKVEITVVGDTTNSYGKTQLSQIEMHLDRPDSSRTPFLSKYNPETLYYSLTAPSFVGDLTGNASTATKATQDESGNNIKSSYGASLSLSGSSLSLLNKNGTSLNSVTLPAAPVSSVNSKTGAVTLTASDVGALPASTSIPSKTSDLTNDSGFVNSSQAASAAPVQSVNGATGNVTISIPQASTTTPANLGTAAIGTSTKWAKADHVHKMPSASDVGALPSSTVIPAASSATPQALGTAAAGTSADYSRADHVHAKPTYSKSDVGLGNVDNVKQYSASNPPPYPVTSVNGSTGAVTVAVPSAATATPSNLGTAAVGTSSKYAKEDHVHNYPDVVYVGSSAPTNTNIELWLDSSSGGNSVVSSVDGKSGVVTVLPSGGTAGQVLKKVSGTSYDVTWSDESGSVTSVNGQTGAVTVHELPSGGTAGQVLSKNSNTDYDASWQSSSGGITFDDVYPVGSIYMSVNSTDPGTLFGGTWEQLKDTFLLGAGDTYTAGDTGGYATHAHTTGNHTLTVNEIPSHTHNIYGGNSDPPDWFGGSGNTYGILQRSGTAYNYLGYAGGGAAHNHGNTGSSSSLPPYIVVYMWQRTA